MAKIKYTPGAAGIRSLENPQAPQGPQGIEVDILVNRAKLPEYPDPEDDGADPCAVTVH